MLIYLCFTKKVKRRPFKEFLEERINNITIDYSDAEAWVAENPNGRFCLVKNLGIYVSRSMLDSNFQVAEQERVRSINYHRRAQKAESELFNQHRKFERQLAEKDAEVKEAQLLLKNWAELSSAEKSKEG